MTHDEAVTAIKAALEFYADPPEGAEVEVRRPLGPKVVTERGSTSQGFATIDRGDRARAALQALSALAAERDDLHERIMNLPCDVEFTTADTTNAYRQGHRDARQAAAEVIREHLEQIISWDGFPRSTEVFPRERARAALAALSALAAETERLRCVERNMNAAIDEVKECATAETRWVSVEERLPKAEVLVMWWLRHHKNCRMGRYDDNGFVRGDSGWASDVYQIGRQVTHWMRLPSAPAREVKHG